MGWGDREAGYAVLRDPDIDRLAALPDGVGCRVFAYPKPDRPAWFITVASGMRPGRKWDGNTAFGEPPPDGAPRYRRALRELSAPFVQAIDALAGEDGGPDSSRYAGLSLGLQLAALLDQPVFGYHLDVDYDEVAAHVTEAGEVRRIRAWRLSCGLDLEYAAGRLRVYPRVPAVFRGIGGVAAARTPFGSADQPLWMCREELTRFAGREVSGPESVIPPVAELGLVAERQSNGQMARVPQAAEPGAAPDRGGIRRSQGHRSPRRRGR